MKDLGYGKDYKYAHNYENAIVPQDYLPDQIKEKRFYFPSNRGFEKKIKDRLNRWRQMMRKSKDNMP